MVARQQGEEGWEKLDSPIARGQRRRRRSTQLRERIAVWSPLLLLPSLSGSWFKLAPRPSASIRQGDAPKLGGACDAGSLAREERANGYYIPGLQGRARPPVSHVPVDASKFDLPGGDSPGCVLHINKKPPVRVRPLHFGDGANQGDGLVPVKLSIEGMVCNCALRNAQQASHGDEAKHLHHLQERSAADRRPIRDGRKS